MDILEYKNGVQTVRPANPSEAAHLSALQSQMPSQKDYTDAVQSMMDAKAREKNYDDIVSACSYAGAPNPFQSEGTAYVAWRGACWARCYEVMAEVAAGQRPQPTIAGLIALMPAFGGA